MLGYSVRYATDRSRWSCRTEGMSLAIHPWWGTITLIDSYSVISGTLHRWQLYQLLLQRLSMKHYVNFLDYTQKAAFRCELYLYIFFTGSLDLLVLCWPLGNCLSSRTTITASSLASLESVTDCHLVDSSVSYFVQSLSFLSGGFYSSWSVVARGGRAIKRSENTDFCA